MKVAYIGFGDFGKQIRRHVETLERPEQVLIFDDVLAKTGEALAFSSMLDEDYSDFCFYIGLGYHHLISRNLIIQKLQSKGRIMPSFQHLSSFVSQTCVIEEACFIYPGCNLDANVQLKAGVVLNNSVVISHDSKIGSASFISPGVLISGNVQIGENTFIGAGCIISNNLSIGDNCIIGAGSLVSKSIASGKNAIGNPMRILTHPLKLK